MSDRVITFTSFVYKIIGELGRTEFFKFARIIGLPERDVTNVLHINLSHLSEQQYNIIAQSWRNYLGLREERDMNDLLDMFCKAVKHEDYENTIHLSNGLSPFLQKSELSINHKFAREIYSFIKNLPPRNQWQQILTTKMFDNPNKVDTIREDHRELGQDEINYQLVKWWLDNKRKTIQDLKDLVHQTLTGSSASVQAVQDQPVADNRRSHRNNPPNNYRGNKNQKASSTRNTPSQRESGGNTNGSGSCDRGSSSSQDASRGATCFLDTSLPQPETAALDEDAISATSHTETFPAPPDTADLDGIAIDELQINVEYQADQFNLRPVQQDKAFCSFQPGKK